MCKLFADLGLLLVAGNICCFLVLVLGYCLYLLVQDYVQPLAWAIVCSIALFPTKTAITDFLLREGGAEIKCGSPSFLLTLTL